ncbi:MAG: transcriptional regulator, partial [Anaerolineales bacterium]
MTILQRLLEGPASGQELIAAVLEKVGPEAYPPTPAARQAAFKRDRQKLRLFLRVEWEFVQQKYILKDSGPWMQLHIPEEALRMLVTLSTTFTGPLGEHAGWNVFWDWLLKRLPEDQRRRLELLDNGITFEIFQQVDPNGIPQRIWETVQRAVRQGQQLEFHYLSPRYEDRQARRFRVAPLRMAYQWGHWYLFAYVLKREEESPPLGSNYSRFRLFYIQNDEVLKVLPSKVSVAHRQPPRYEVHYRLLPPLGRGAVSRHFEEMTITP